MKWVILIHMSLHELIPLNLSYEIKYNSAVWRMRLN